MHSSEVVIEVHFHMAVANFADYAYHRAMLEM